MRRVIVLAALSLAIPVTALAHVTVTPRASKPGAEEKYTVRVPTEKPVSTTSVDLEVPDGVTVSEVLAPEGATHTEKRQGDRIVAITWTMEIKPQQRAEFVFTAKNPASTTSLTWKVHQRYSDGTVSDWTPATTLGETPAPAAMPGAAPAQSAASSPDMAAMETWLKGYDAAFNAKDLEKLATFYHPDVTIYEGGGLNNGWVDYRDTHLGPELKEFQNLQFAHTNIKATLLGDGRGAYMTSMYSLKAKMGERDVDSGGLETLVLVKDTGGAWKIRHSHTSARARRPPAGQ